MNGAEAFTTQYDWATGGLVAVLGFGTVFVVLMIIMFVLIIMEKIFAKSKAPKKEESVVKPITEAVVNEKVEDEVDDFEIISVLTAAIAASLNTSTYNLRIKSYKRLGDASSLWGDASKKENVYNRL